MSKHSKRGAKRKTFFLMILFLLVLCIASFSAYTFELKPRKAWMAAESELSQQHYEAAAELYKTIKGYKNSTDQYGFTYCASLFKAGKTAEAAEYYKKLSGEPKAKIDALMGSFETLGKQALASGEYDDAWAYLSIAELSDDTKAALAALEIRKEALDAMNAEDYGKAREVLSKADDTYINATALTEQCYSLEFDKYDRLSETDMNKAIEGLEGIREYAPAAKYLKEIQEYYSQAINWVKDGSYADAKTLFEKLGNYRDSAKLLAKCDRLLSGETVTLYEKGELVTLGTLDGETIIWTVAEVKEGVATLISNSPVAHMAFDENGASRWTATTLSKWFKNDFMNCFNASEKNQISNISIRFGNDLDTCYAHPITEEELALLSGFDLSAYSGKIWLGGMGETSGTARAFSVKNTSKITEEPVTDKHDVMAVLRLKF